MFIVNRIVEEMVKITRKQWVQQELLLPMPEDANQEAGAEAELALVDEAELEKMVGVTEDDLEFKDDGAVATNETPEKIEGVSGLFGGGVSAVPVALGGIGLASLAQGGNNSGEAQSADASANPSGFEPTSPSLSSESANQMPSMDTPSADTPSMAPSPMTMPALEAPSDGSPLMAAPVMSMPSGLMEFSSPDGAQQLPLLSLPEMASMDQRQTTQNTASPDDFMVSPVGAGISSAAGDQSSPVQQVLKEVS
jgi:hypothetical protein